MVQMKYYGFNSVQSTTSKEAPSKNKKNPRLPFQSITSGRVGTDRMGLRSHAKYLLSG